MARSRRMELLRRLPPRWRSRLLLLGFNWHPAFRATGGRVHTVSHDLLHIVVRLPLRRRTRNIVGSLYGGFLFAITDGVHAAMLMAGLNRPVVVWDKAAQIRYRRPGYQTLYANFHISPQELDDIRHRLDQHHETDATFTVQIQDPQGQIYTIVERTLYIADADFYRQKSTSR